LLRPVGPRPDHAPAARFAAERHAGAARGGEPESIGGFRIGQNVQHPRFGLGVIVDAEGSGSHTCVQVNFDAHGMKLLDLKYAKLTAA
ncbi:MAG: DNA helicase II, partial [Candidatus Accumulibacter sp.]|jgi:DNA helicase-2/ATP-dependent DNA helicase PcrA|nr:DNA helicase II [Accumulibacter sp.]